MIWGFLDRIPWTKGFSKNWGSAVSSALYIDGHFRSSGKHSFNFHSAQHHNVTTYALNCCNTIKAIQAIDQCNNCNMIECTHVQDILPTKSCVYPNWSFSIKCKSSFQTSDSKFGTREGMMKKPLKFCGMFKLQLGTNLNPNQPKAAFMACVIFKPDKLPV